MVLGEEGADEGSESDEDLEEGSYEGGILCGEALNAFELNVPCEADRRNDDDVK